jgi:hypothetical protein
MFASPLPSQEMFAWAIECYSPVSSLAFRMEDALRDGTDPADETLRKLRTEFNLAAITAQDTLERISKSNDPYRDDLTIAFAGIQAAATATVHIAGMCSLEETIFAANEAFNEILNGALRAAHVLAADSLHTTQTSLERKLHELEEPHEIADKQRKAASYIAYTAAFARYRAATRVRNEDIEALGGNSTAAISSMKRSSARAEAQVARGAAGPDARATVKLPCI